MLQEFPLAALDIKMFYVMLVLIVVAVVIGLVKLISIMNAHENKCFEKQKLETEEKNVKLTEFLDSNDSKVKVIACYSSGSCYLSVMVEGSTTKARHKLSVSLGDPILPIVGDIWVADVIHGSLKLKRLL